MTLHEPYHFVPSGKIAPNRISLAPMTNMQSHEDGTLSDDEYRWLVRRAKEGFGVIFTCAAHVSPDGQGWKGELGIFHDRHLEGLTRLARGIQEYGSLAIVQIFHGGARSPEKLTGLQPWSASAHSMTFGDAEVASRAATEEDIEQVIEAFVEAAVRAYQAGFDGVELHGAHGYLLHQFLSTETNRRTDQWGGTSENRTRLIRKILTDIKAVVPASFMVGVRLSPEDLFTYKGIDFDEALDTAAMLARDGADFIHVSPWDTFKKPEKYPDADKSIVTYFREKLPPNVPLITAGNIWSAADAQQVLDMGADFIALGRAGIGVPDWPTRARDAAFVPQRPPYSVQHLREADLSEVFITYMRRWKDFVK